MITWRESARIIFEPLMVLGTAIRVLASKMVGK